jgi:murein tripeptide amidase MpaA
MFVGAVCSKLTIVTKSAAAAVEGDDEKKEKSEVEEKSWLKIIQEEPQQLQQHKVFTYTGYQVLDVIPKDADQLKVLKKLEHSTAKAPGFEFWKEPYHVNESCSVSVHPNLVEVMQNYLDMKNITHEVVIEDLQALIDKEMEDITEDEDGDGLSFRDPSISYYSHEKYNRLEQITKHVRELRTKYPGLLDISTIGTTHESKPIEMVTLSVGDGSDRAVIFIDCGIHAREWISPSFCMYAMDQILKKGKMGMLGHFDFYFVPVANPDGYEYTWTNNRMWRKNKRPAKGGSSYPAAQQRPKPNDPGLPTVAVESIPKTARQLKEDAEKEKVTTKQFWGGVFPGVQFGGQGQPSYPKFPQYPQYPGEESGGVIGGGSGFGGVVGGTPGEAGGRPSGIGGGHGFGGGLPGGGKECFGVDPNRNFDLAWAQVGSSAEVCQETYHGPAPFSEAESKALRDAIKNIVQIRGKRLAAYLSVHAYSQFWMSPYGYTKKQAQHYGDHMKVMKAATTALKAEYGTEYKYGPIQKVIYQAGGSSVDWVYEKMNVKYSFALELRDTGRFAFLLPVDQIMPTNKETWAGVNAMAFSIAKEYPVNDEKYNI